jgi:Sedlin, N-terminal conserved region
VKTTLSDTLKDLNIMASSAPPTQSLFLVIVGKNEPLYEAEFLKRGAVPSSDAVTRQNYFVLHSALDLVENVAWTTNQMFLKVVDKVGRARAME